MNRGDPTLGGIAKGGGCEDHKEIDLHRIPTQDPKVYDDHLDRFACDLKDQPIIKTKPQGLGNSTLNRHLHCSGIKRSTGDQLVMRRDRLRIGEIELTIEKSLGPITVEISKVNRLTVNRNQSAPDHRRDC